MTASEQLHALQVEKERAQKDMADIAFLRQNEAFNRYWRRRMTERHDAIVAQFTRGKMKKNEREVMRRLMLEYQDEIAARLDKDEIACQRLLAVTPERPRMPGSLGNS
jgi:hypothetical protein